MLRARSASRSSKPAPSNTASMRSVAWAMLGPRNVAPTSRSSRETIHGCRSVVERTLWAKRRAASRQSSAPPPGALGTRYLQLAVDLVDDELDELVAAGDVPVEGRGPDPQPGGELAHAQRVDALGVEQAERFGDDLLPGE